MFSKFEVDEELVLIKIRKNIRRVGTKEERATREALARNIIVIKSEGSRETFETPTKSDPN